MIPVLLAEDVRRHDAEAVARGVSIEQLMRNAGWAVARAARGMLGGTYGRRVVVVCGKGNNAGDGLVAAQLLHEAGAAVTVTLVFPRAELNEHAARELARFGGRVVEVSGLERELARADLALDAIFGVGLTRAPEGEARAAIEAMARNAAPVLATDIPSGVHADTGITLGSAVPARATITFGGTKMGLLSYPGAAYAGTVEIADIGTRATAARAAMLERQDVRGILPSRSPDLDKRGSGVVLVVAGSRAMPGAAALASAACVNGGAGLTTLCAPEEVCASVVTRVPEITTIPVPSTGEGTIAAKALEVLGPQLGRFDGIVVGPGLSRHPSTIEFVRALIAESKQQVVLDADGINAFLAATDLLATRGAPLVITPHAGEFARIMGLDRKEIAADRLSVARRAANELGVTVVLKGPATVIDDGASAFVNPTGGPALAQGGTGDVLAGLLGAILSARAAQHSLRHGDLPMAHAHADLVAAGVWVHGRAADRIAARIAPHPANATALIDEIGPTLHEVFA